MREIYKGWQQFWAEFFRIKHLHSIQGIREWNKKLVTHAIEALSLDEGDRILDLACGGGDQAIEFAHRSISVVGVDIAKALVDYGNAAVRRENLPVKLIQGDMRDANFADEFDACVIMSGSFGFFDDQGNAEVLRVIEKALKPNGRFYIHGPNPLNKMRERWKGWDEVDGGFVLMTSNYDPETGKIGDGFSLYVSDEGKIVKFQQMPEDKGFSLETRIYTLAEMINLIQAANLRFRDAYGSIELPLEKYSINSSSMIVVGERA